MAMRVTDSYLSSILVGDLNRSLGQLLQQQRMAGSMRRVNTFADDPRAVSSIQRYNALLANNNQYLDNVGRSRLIVDGTDVALQNISEVLAEVRVTALRECSALATPQSMATAVVDVENHVNRLLDILNTTIEGNYIFSGRDIGTPAYARSGDTIVYQGDDHEIRSRTGPNSTMAVNIPGNVFVGTQSSSLGGTTDLAPRLLTTTSLNDLNMGQGWEPGLIRLEDALGNSFLVDLSGAVTVDDVLTEVNTATGGVITAALRPDGAGFEFTGTGPLSVSDVGETDTATSLGINNTGLGSVLTGLDIRAAAADTTNLADIEALGGSLPLGTIDVTWQGTTYNVDFSGAATLGDLATTFNAAVPGMELQVRDSSIVIIGNSPEVFQVANGDATNTASLLGIAGNGAPTRLFGLLEDLKTALTAGDKDAVRGAIAEMSSVETMVYQLMTMNGGRQNDLDWAEGILRQRDERLQANLSLEYDVDVAEVSAELARAETSYQASLLVTSKLYEANLMQYLR